MSAVVMPTLTGTVMNAISDEEILQPNRLAWVTPHFLIVRNVDRQTHTIIPLARLSAIHVVKTPYSGLLAIAAGVFIIAAAAFASKQGEGAAVPCALLGAFLMTTYFLSRRANITFSVDVGGKEIVSGSTSEATALIQLIESARASAVADFNEETDLSTASCASPSVIRGPKAAQPAFEPSGFV